MPLDPETVFETVPETVPDTVTEAVSLLQAAGYVDVVTLGPDGLSWSTCGHHSGLADLVDVRVDRVFRFEGDSDPADEMLVLGVSCSACDASGVVVSAYGVDVDADQADALRRLAAHRPRS